jgi:Kelch motif/Galactose oxidase, central domain
MTMRLRPLALALLALAAVPTGATADSWTRAEDMPNAPAQHTATLLQNGQVLVAGGDDGGAIAHPAALSERYDPASGHWLGTPSFLNGRYAQAASLLPDGRVLMTGGYRSGLGVTQALLGSALVFDPATNNWASIADMPHLHGFHTQVTLQDGRVLVVSGYEDLAEMSRQEASNLVELYDTATGTWTSAASTPLWQVGHTTTLLDDGSVLMVGGASSGTPHTFAYRYLPATNAWRGAGNLTDARQDHVAALLADGRVLIAGGLGNGGRELRTASLYDPATNSWTDVAPMATPRWKATATTLPNGKVLVAGGYDGRAYAASAELFDPATNTWTPAPSMATGRYQHTATLLADGRVLVAGGRALNPTNRQPATLSSAEIYTPDGWPFTRGGDGSGGGGGGSGASGRPAISRLALSATRFRAAGSGPSVTAARRRRAPIGTTISYRDGAVATATFAVQRPASGRRSSGRCVKPTHANRRKAHCTRWTTIGHFRHADVAGTNTIRFTGRVSGHKLSPGSYRLSITARIGRGRASSPTLVGFRIVR